MYLRRRYEESRPKIAEMSIPNGALDVDPRLAEIAIRFDRPMRTTRSAMRDPRFGKVRFNETGTVLTIAVVLEPDQEYEFDLTWPDGGTFTSVDGVPIKDVTVRFRTRGL